MGAGAPVLPGQTFAPQEPSTGRWPAGATHWAAGISAPTDAVFCPTG